jgi:hypothetical protein
VADVARRVEVFVQASLTGRPPLSIRIAYFVKGVARISGFVSFYPHGAQRFTDSSLPVLPDLPTNTTRSGRYTHWTPFGEWPSPQGSRGEAAWWPEETGVDRLPVAKTRFLLLQADR